MRSPLSALAVVIVVGTIGCRRASEKKQSAAPAPSPVMIEDAAPTPGDLLSANGLGLRTSTEADARVRNVFPHGVATEDARAEIGTSPAPPDDVAPDPMAEWIGELVLTQPLELATVRAALPPRPGANAAGHFVRAQTRAGAWEYVEDETARGPYVRVAVEVSIVDIDEPVTAAELDREIAWTRTFLGKLEAREPTVSMTRRQAIAKGESAFKLRKQLSDDDISIGLAIVAQNGKKFPARLVWDVVYSAGFRWGDGDYFHWVPTPNTDISQGIGMGGTSSEAGYFMPEWVARNDGSADVTDLEMSFNIARTWEPSAVFDVMVRAANYMARRLGGTVVSVESGVPFDEKAARTKLHSTVKAMTNAGIKPGSSLALQVF